MLVYRIRVGNSSYAAGDPRPTTTKNRKKNGKKTGFSAGNNPARGSSQKLFFKLAGPVGTGQEVFRPHGSGRAGPGRKVLTYHVSGRVILARSDPRAMIRYREKPSTRQGIPVHTTIHTTMHTLPGTIQKHILENASAQEVETKEVETKEEETGQDQLFHQVVDSHTNARKVAQKNRRA